MTCLKQYPLVARRRRNFRLFMISAALALLSLLARIPLPNFGLAGTTEDAPSVAQPEAREFALLTDTREITARLQQMSPAQRQALQRQQERFQALSRGEQQRYRTLHRQLQEHPRAEQLLQTARNYYSWLSTLSAAGRAELMDQLRDRGPRDRVTLVRAAREAQEKEWLRRNLAGLSPADAAALQQFLQSYVTKHEEELRRRLPPRAQEFWARLDPPRRNRLLMVSLAMRVGARDFPSVTAEELATLEAALSTAATRQLQQAQGELAKRQLIESWARALWQRADRLPPVPPEELEQFYLRELSAEQRDRLNELSPQEMQRTLRRIYLQDRLEAPNGRSGPRRHEMRHGPGPPPPVEPDLP